MKAIDVFSRRNGVEDALCVDLRRERHLDEDAVDIVATVEAVDDGEKVVVGVNRFTDAETDPTEVFPIDVKLQQIQIDRTRSVRAERDQAAVERALADVAETAKGDGNLLVPMKAALKQFATLGEVSDVLRAEFGVYQPGG